MIVRRLYFFIMGLFCLLVLRASGCTKKSAYNLRQPDAVYVLPKSLNEISGLSYIKNDLLLCIQDEKGSLYVYDLKNEKIVDKIKFGKSGDYEGVEVVGNTAYVIRSDGKLYIIANIWEAEKRTISDKKLNTLKGCDVEGLGWDAASGRLMIACKELKNTENHNLYAWSSKTQTLEDYDFAIKDADLKPSGIAMHPQTGNIYLLSSASNRLLVLSPKGKEIMRYQLSNRIFRQAEGITFSPQGDLYISNEAKGKEANILRLIY